MEDYKKDYNNINKNKSRGQLEKQAKDMYRIHRGGYLNDQKNKKRCTTSLIILEVQIRTSVRCHFTPIKNFFLKKGIIIFYLSPYT